MICAWCGNRLGTECDCDPDGLEELRDRYTTATSVVLLGNTARGYAQMLADRASEAMRQHNAYRHGVAK